jgi:hypothetical protein
MDQNQTGLAAGNGKAGEACSSKSSQQVSDSKANGGAQGPEQTETGSKKVRGRSKQSVALIEAMYAAAAAARPITGRGIGYKLFVKHLIASMSRAQMQRVYRLLKDAREDGTIPWGWIVDETRGLEISATWSSPEEFAEEMAAAYRRSFWDQQPVRCQVWSEKGTVRGLLKPVLNRYGVGFNPVHGFTSATDAYNVSQDDDGRDLIVLYVGDFDPSGMFMSEEDLPKRFAKYGGDHITLKRIALTGKHVLDLPSFPAADKRKDPRFKWFADRYGDQCWELDAMDPNDLRDCVEAEIKALIEPEAWKRCEVVNEAQRINLKEFLDKWNSLEKFEAFRREWLADEDEVSS